VAAAAAQRLAVATRLALQAGAAIAAAIDGAKVIENKGANDLVTATDKVNVAMDRS
jgi:hypothetical protein